MDYKNSGVDIEAGYKSVELMKKYVQGTMRPEVLTGLGGFSGAFSMEKFKNMEKPTLVSGTDGVGTKIKLAFLMDKHDTIGIDCVAMCVNDIACAGGEPLFFLDYIACGKNYPEKIASIVSGVAEGCKQSDAALIGGETAEHPGLMPEDEYDLAGFAVGVVDEKDIITGADLKAGDVLIGMASSGVHSNGFSLVRKIFEMTKESLDTYYDELGKTIPCTIAHKNYVAGIIARVVAGKIKILLSYPASRERLKECKEYDARLKKKYPDIYYKNKNMAIKILRWSSYKSYWIAHSLLNVKFKVSSI